MKPSVPKELDGKKQEKPPEPKIAAKEEKKPSAPEAKKESAKP